MKTKNNIKTATIAFALILMFATSMITVLPIAQAAYDVPTWVFLYVTPNPIGVGQGAFINTLMSKPAPTANGFFGDHYKGVTVEVTRPDGTKETLGPFTADAAAAPTLYTLLQQRVTTHSKRFILDKQ